MGRGRQKAKQQKIARKLKYLTTDTDYDELAKELNSQEPGTGSYDPIADAESQYERDHTYADEHAYEEYESDEESSEATSDDQLDEYAQWAAEAAARATEHTSQQAKPVAHKPIPMPVPGAWKHNAGNTKSEH